MAIQTISDKKRIDNVIDSFKNIESSAIAFIRHNFNIELLKVVKASIKNTMVELITQGKMTFINEGKIGLTVKSKFFSSIIEQLSDNDIKPPEEWNIELQRFFHLLMSRFIPSGKRFVLFFYFGRS